MQDSILERALGDRREAIGRAGRAEAALERLRALVHDGDIYSTECGWYSRVAGDVLADAIADALGIARP